MTASTTPSLSRSLDTRTLRHAYGQFPSGVVAIAAEVDGERTGLAASTFVPVSLDPPLVAFCIQNTSATWPKLVSAPRLGVSALGADLTGAARSLGSKGGDRFAGLDTLTSDAGALFVEGAAAWLETSVHETLAAGDHAIVLLRVHNLTVRPEVSPMVFHGSSFRELAAVPC
ncbi:flavin reductase (DIM6/NTAB) family NADH-FMN oxidoreductase RutF [Streptomyces sp. SAI-135]|uniref:flavin reductase family protein n=1 Tax=unclassified Streptomyces TaxID=2593676 RepID=UPI00247445AC|nr:MULTISPECIES: flavin reductase family protein [unclassified Streptomyces]MDH6523377.1 flavin reductase (DIM6/NTAB) family NADH-FMN oxidoreductase RutF [Streptomyces sp. SAI-090]MDH6554999.1 flavin reductase (DIM6/NTAB) family NADH-FMN oxidoreductase RutF [Streptomyces sp. SAI-041]MDH6574265.1 flavin reductase (DIM6/NTAB) family NADH-FMN oxidoreductase RutF [Streptomyces sp. SAI-117]MDH6581002.1 flavin reductase (DIM6/NTAB) family NADH-FMN oxidoreductase RutF [Streptomyces sp. SAI-133]MDH661